MISLTLWPSPLGGFTTGATRYSTRHGKQTIRGTFPGMREGSKVPVAYLPHKPTIGAIPETLASLVTRTVIVVVVTAIVIVLPLGLGHL